MAEKIGNDEVRYFIVAFKYGECGWDWPKVAIGLSKVDINWTNSSRSETDKIKMCQYNVYRTTDDHIHAESHFLDSLRNITSEKDKKIIHINAELVQNYSPCSECARKFVEFIQEIKKKRIIFSLTIKFANFYKCYYTLENDSWKRSSPSKECLDGLVKLRQNGVTLQLLQGEQDWEKFVRDERFVEISEKNRTRLLEMATSDERKEREKVDKIILKYIETEALSKPKTTK